MAVRNSLPRNDAEYGTKEQDMEQMPEGYMKNSRGHLVLNGDVPLLDRQRDQVVHEMLGQAMSLSGVMAESKRRWLETIQAHVQLAAEQYDVKVGGESGAVTLTSFDGSIKVERQYSRMLVVNERVAVAKELVERYAASVSSELDGDTKRLIRAVFRVDEKGNFSATSLLSLARRIKSESPEWQAAVAAINDAVTSEYGEPYVRFYVRDDQGNYQQIPLDFSGV